MFDTQALRKVTKLGQRLGMATGRSNDDMDTFRGSVFKGSILVSPVLASEAKKTSLWSVCVRTCASQNRCAVKSWLYPSKMICIVWFEVAPRLWKDGTGSSRIMSEGIGSHPRRSNIESFAKPQLVFFSTSSTMWGL